MKSQKRTMDLTEPTEHDKRREMCRIHKKIKDADFRRKNGSIPKERKGPQKSPLIPLFSKGETILLPLLKGGWEGFLGWPNNWSL